MKEKKRDLSPSLDTFHEMEIIAQNRVEMEENKENIFIKAKLPGFSEEGIKIHLDNQRLLVVGDDSQDIEIEESDYLQRESRRGHFFKMIQLPVPVKNEIASSFEDGILYITLNKILLGKKESNQSTGGLKR